MYSSSSGVRGNGLLASMVDGSGALVIAGTGEVTSKLCDSVVKDDVMDVIGSEPVESEVELVELVELVEYVLPQFLWAEKAFGEQQNKRVICIDAVT